VCNYPRLHLIRTIGILDGRTGVVFVVSWHLFGVGCGAAARSSTYKLPCYGGAGTYYDLSVGSKSGSSTHSVW
jgi:hypothetical protein